MHIDPAHEQAVQFGERAADPEPVHMLNLLRFADGASGVELYARYAEAIAPHLRRVGGEIIWSGTCDRALIGPDEPEWDMAAVVRYPSRSAFLDMVRDPAYQESTKLRTAALADSRLIPCGPGGL
jgi:uncharacterized protein (DUF1330 family)